MTVLVAENVEAAFRGVLKRESSDFETIENRESYIDFLNTEISRYIAKILTLEMQVADSEQVSAYFKATGNLERIADHAMNIAEYEKQIETGSEQLSAAALDEVEQMRAVMEKVMRVLDYTPEKGTGEMLKLAAQGEQRIDDMCAEFRNNQINRMRKGYCSADVGILYAQMLTDFERMGDHVLNIAEACAGMKGEQQ